MFTKVLVATDLSEASERVIGAVSSLKTLETREAVLIHCFNVRDVGSLADRLMELAKPSFERQKKILEDHGFDVTAKMVVGLPQIEINRQADEHDCSLVVVGSTGGTMAGEIMLGGVASAVIHNATRPVLILRLKLAGEEGKKACEQWAGDCLRHVLFPTDFSDNAEHAFSHVHKMAERGAKRITPNIVQVFDANTILHRKGEYGYFTMENVPAGSLDKFWKSHGARLVPVETSVDIMKQVCRGLVLAHSEDPPIIHRDIKPQNILIGYQADGLRAKLSDFGLAKQVNKLTLFATAAGTLAFKPPEVFTQDKGDSMAADIWALGVTLYMLLTDNIPFQVDQHLGWGNAGSLATPPPVPSQYNVESNAALDGIVLKCLAPNPEDRYSDAKELLKVLGSWEPSTSTSGKPHTASTSASRFSKDALGRHSTPDSKEADSLARQAIRMAVEGGDLREAADTMEEAFNKWPSLRDRYAKKVLLWRRGISM